MWQRFIPAAVVDDVDVELLVDRTEGFSPADIEYAARSASQRALEKAVYDDGGAASGGSVSVREAVRKGPSTQDYLDAIARYPDHGQRGSAPAVPRGHRRPGPRLAGVANATRVRYRPYPGPDWALGDPALQSSSRSNVILFLTIVSGVAWTVVYVEAIRLGLPGAHLRHPRGGPCAELRVGGNLRARSVATGISAQGVFNIVWGLADVAHRVHLPQVWPGRTAAPGLRGRSSPAGPSCWASASFAVQLLFVVEFGWEDAARYAAFLQNLLMSGLFIAMFAPAAAPGASPC